MRNERESSIDSCDFENMDEKYAQIMTDEVDEIKPRERDMMKVPSIISAVKLSDTFKNVHPSQHSGVAMRHGPGDSPSLLPRRVRVAFGDGPTAARRTQQKGGAAHATHKESEEGSRKPTLKAKKEQAKNNEAIEAIIEEGSKESGRRKKVYFNDASTK